MTTAACKLCFSLLVGLFASFGCTAKTNVVTARCEGAVTYRGQPVNNGGVSFTPLGRGRAIWAPIQNGRYLALAVPCGQVRIQVSAQQRTGKTVFRDGATVDEEVSIVPDKFRRGIEINVSDDRADLDFNLSE